MTDAIRVDRLHFAYPGGVQALDDASLTVRIGERWGLAGANGSGKSTLLHHCAGVYAADPHVTVLGRVASAENLPWIRSQVGLLFQRASDQLFLPTVREDVAFGPLNLGLARSDVERRVETALRQVGLADRADRAPHQLSGGEQRAAAFATILSLEPAVLALDEPTNDLDPAGRRSVIEFLNKWQGTILIASHDLEMLLEVTGQIAILSAGHVALTGASRAVLGDAASMARYRLEVPASLLR